MGRRSDTIFLLQNAKVKLMHNETHMLKFTVEFCCLQTLDILLLVLLKSIHQPNVSCQRRMSSRVTAPDGHF